MSDFKGYDDNKMEAVETMELKKGFNLDNLAPDGELQEQIAALRKKDRVKMLIAGFAAGLMLTIGVGYYVADAGANAGYQSNSGTTYTATAAGSYAGSSTSGAAGAAGIAGGGGCCGGGGAGGGALGSASLPDLEKQALAEYKKETGATDVQAKATNFGCHIQIDISDKTGKVIRSYGYQGGPLYVIK